MEQQKKVFVVFTFFLALGAITLICVSLATDHWVESDPLPRYNLTEGEENINKVNFGLFKGGGMLNPGIGLREKTYSVVCSASNGVCLLFSEDDTGYNSGLDYIDAIVKSNSSVEDYELGLFSYGYWLMTIVFAALSIVFGLSAMGFAVFNIWGKPIETITGPMGLYLWSGFGFLFTVLEMIMFLVLFLTSLKKNFIVVYYDRFHVEDYTNPGYSFYLVPAAAALYLMNIIFLSASGYKFQCSFSSEAEKVVDNGMILY